MTINETVTGTGSVAIIGSAQGETTLGVRGVGDSTGVQGVGKAWNGVEGFTDSTIGGVGVFGAHRAGGTAIAGDSPNGFGVLGKGGTGVVGESEGWVGVFGTSKSTNGGSGVWGEHKAGGNAVVGISETGVGIFGKGGRLAGYFEGVVEITGDIRLIGAGDCAENFDIADLEVAEPGTVMVLDNEGTLQSSGQAYDKLVAGVISGAGDFRPGIILGPQEPRPNRKPIALVGKVYCKVDAQYGEIEIGDLLTTSNTPGHAMKVTDPLRAFGAVIGKALRPLKEGNGLIPILIALQ